MTAPCASIRVWDYPKKQKQSVSADRRNALFSGVGTHRICLLFLFSKENHPEAKKKLRLPDQLELVMEDGTVYRVRSFFVAEQQMGDVLDAFSLEKVNREN